MYQTLKENKWFYQVAMAAVIGIFLCSGILDFDDTDLARLYSSTAPADIFFKVALGAIASNLVNVIRLWLVEIYKSLKDKKVGK